MSRIIIILTLLLSVTRLIAQTPLPPETIKEMRPSVVQGRVVADYSTLYYEELGRGEPVILIHDHTLTNEMWEHQFYTLSHRFRMIRYDLRGYGESSPQLEMLHFTHAEDLITLMNALGIDKAHLIGLGTGGAVAADMLASSPDRVASAILVSGNLQKIPGPSQLMTADESAKRDRQIARLDEADKHKMRQKRLEAYLKTAGSNREEIRPALTRIVMAWDVWQPFHKEARVLGGWDTCELLKEKRPATPVLVVEGRLSGKASVKRPEIMDYLPAARFEVMNDCGRLPNMEQPEAFNRLVLDFLLPAAGVQ